MPRIYRIIVTVVLMSLLSLCAFATDSSIKAVEENNIISTNGVDAALVYNIENDTMVFSHNEKEVLVPGSLTKMMTAVCAYELLSDRLDETIIVKGEVLNGISLNYFGYKDGNTVKIRDLFGGLLTRGYNDSAALLCYAASGSVEGFVDYMNKRASELGMKDTVYVNPTGLDEAGAATSAADTLVIAREFYKIPMLVEISNTLSYKAETSIFTNRNDFLNSGTYFDSRITGMNVGWTANSGYCAASAVENEVLSYIIVVLGGEEIGEKVSTYTLTSSLATYALGGFDYIDVIKEGKIIGEIPVELSTDADFVTFVPASSLTLYLPTSLDIATDLTYSYRLDAETLDAPVTEGQVVGSYTVSQDGVILGSVDLVTKNSLARSEFLVVLDAIESFTTSTFFIVTIIAAIVLTIGYFIVSSLMRNRRRTRRYSTRRR
ncbi:MAG: D-alanyl-D-alanine carboxypeptidase [Clostridia bacterium]|nr:D-alanyl-D-alanine carboxypeptidase [Clostridia bacterium]